MEQVKRTPEAARSEEVCVVLQRIHEARMEQMQGGPGRYDEQVLPDSKAGASARQREAREAEERSRREEREKERRDRQRTRQQHGLRHIWNTLLRPGASDTSAGTPDVPGVPPGTPTSDDGNSADYVVGGCCIQQDQATAAFDTGKAWLQQDRW